MLIICKKLCLPTKYKTKISIKNQNQIENSGEMRPEEMRQWVEYSDLTSTSDSGFSQMHGYQRAKKATANSEASTSGSTQNKQLRKLGSKILYRIDGSMRTESGPPRTHWWPLGEHVEFKTMSGQ